MAVWMVLGSVGAAATAHDPATIRSVSVERGADGPVVHVATTGHLEVVHYSPQPGIWVLEAPASAYQAAVPVVSAPELGIERAELALAEEYGKALTRLTVWLDRPAAAKLVEREEGLDLLFGASEALPAASAAVAVEPAEPLPAQSAPAPAAPAANLYRVEPEVRDAGLVVRLDGDGRFTGTTFTLPDPPRAVLDLPGVVYRGSRHVFPVGAVGVRRVRVAQHAVEPEPVTRVVVDLEDPSLARSMTFEPGSSGAELQLGVVDGSRVSQPAVTGTGANTGGTIEISSSRRARPAAEGSGAPAEPTGDAEAAAARHRSEPGPLEAPVAAGSAADRPEPAQPERGAPEPAGAAAPGEASGSDPFTADPTQLVERAAAAQELDLGEQAKAFAAKEVESEERQFTGEPLSLTLKDADIKDVLRSFAKMTGLNIVVDPGVSGSVTVELHDVPWDQALDLILKINGLDYVLENNVLRVAPTSKLAAEKAARAKLAEQEELAGPMKTIVKPLSYAKAQEVSKLLQQEGFLVSQRGSIIVDEATNTLIIRDVVDRLPGIQKLISILDRPVPQVLIEARIVETTRNFSHKLGVNWGFSGVMDVEHGNDTGLNFPNSVSVGGGVNLGIGYPGGVRGDVGTIGFSFGDILNTFNLDFLLSAAENEGLVRIVSSPKVIAQNNHAATIRSGLQLPVQTVANNTVTVQYVDATLRLEVTPQITAEGTVVLDLDIKKQEPATALLVQGAQNAPIFTRDAKTKLLVRDVGTQMIGGIYQLNDQDTNNRVPGLHRIPLLGWLFRGKEIQQRHDELLIFITPRIMKY